MARLLKCYGFCNSTYEKEVLEKEGSKNYCPSCIVIVRKEKEERELLYKTISLVYGIPYPTGQMLKQMSDFKKERGYSYENINKTICYFIKVMKKQPTVNGAISFVPWYYDKAVQYYDEQDRRREASKDIDTTDNVKILKITKHSTVDTRDPIIKKRFIEMGDILNDG